MIPRLYAIADADLLLHHGVGLQDYAMGLQRAGVELVQYRDKSGAPQRVLEAIATLKHAFSGTQCRIIVNDRADLAALSGADGVHIGQDDISPADARSVVGSRLVIGISTHTEAQVQAAEVSCADYVAIGPLFSTSTKANPDPVVGLQGVRRARQLTSKPLVAIGGITRENARAVIEAGADSVAVISGLLQPGTTVEQLARDFLDNLR